MIPNPQDFFLAQSEPSKELSDWLSKQESTAFYSAAFMFLFINAVGYWNLAHLPSPAIMFALAIIGFQILAAVMSFITALVANSLFVVLVKRPTQ